MHTAMWTAVAVLLAFALIAIVGLLVGDGRAANESAEQEERRGFGQYDDW